MKYRSFFARSLVGLAIYAGKLRMIHIKKLHRHYQIKQAAVIELKAGALLEGKIKDWDGVSEAIADLVNQWQLRECAAAIAISSRLIRSQSITLPPGLSDAAIATEIQVYVQRDLSETDESLCIDFLENKTSGSSKIVFAATRRAYLSRYIQCVEEAGLKVKIVDIETYALARAACMALQSSLLVHEIMALLYVESTMAFFIIFNSQEILFNQEWESSDTSDLTAQIKKGLSIYFAMSSHGLIYKALFWGVNEEIKAVLQSYLENKNDSILSPCFFSKMHSLNEIPAAHELLIAGGLAIREVPLW